MNDAVQDLPSPEQVRKQRILDEVKKELKKVRSYTPKVGVFGDTREFNSEVRHPPMQPEGIL